MSEKKKDKDKDKPIPCPLCGTTGKVLRIRCRGCGGSGWIK
jgi:RecJ-like exonuclease